ncbi:MAG: NAD-dependent epimerase/dehydratase family protein [Elusimicrobia bacterium]|nr:NAD-dependent epimerase/dehydratase family protein [Elusimicrobiota bacterium]
MRILVLGGTVFVGRHFVEAALARGHAVTLFNRGRHGPDLFPQAEKLRGDRDHDLSALRGRTFDAVFDPSGYRPEQVGSVVEALGAGIPHYTFVSSISAYRRFPPGRPFDEDAPLAAGSAGYGALKARCEEALEAALPGRVAQVRPGLIVGPHDPTGRFTYWPRRLAQGGRVLAPGRPQRPIQFIDARDLAGWCVRLAEARRAGRFTAVGPESRLTMGELLAACAQAAGGDARLTWAADEELAAAGVEPWSEMPLWIPEADPVHGGMLLADNRRALASGLTLRPVGETIRATLEWEAADGGPQSDAPNRVTPISREREAAVLEKIKSKRPRSRA